VSSQTLCTALPGSAYHRVPGTAPYASKQGAVIAAFPESLHLVETAHLGAAAYAVMCFGDTDHDGRGEVACYDLISGTWRLHVFESQGGAVYSGEYIGDDVIPYALCDLDRDGKGEVLAQRGSQLRVYEATDASSYPSQLVWTSKNLTNIVGESTVGDTDRDGRMEIIHSVSSFGDQGYICIFENVGDNSYAQVCSLQVTTGAMGKKAMGDLDLDGIPEIAFGTIHGGIYIVKSTGDNQWRTQWVMTTDLLNAYGASIGPDLDGDGKPELFITGARLEGWTTLIIESSGVDQYSVVDTLLQYDGWNGGGRNTVGNFTGSGRHEFAMEGYVATWICGATGPGQWELVSTLPNSDGRHVGVYAVDLNHNGRDELFWGSDGSPSTVYEQRGLVASVQVPPPTGIGRLCVSPNPVRLEAALQWPASVGAASRLRVYDVAGRLVQALPLARSGPQARWHPAGLGAGIYLLRLESASGAPMALGRVTVVR
jgi:hypothetical protein